MAAKEMYDYLSAVTPDVDQTLNVQPQQVVEEEGEKNQIVHLGDDGSEKRVSLDDNTIFFVMLKWKMKVAADAGTIFDFYHSTSKGNGVVNSFKWTHPTDGHTYVVRFSGPIKRFIRTAAVHGFGDVRLRVLGRIND